MLHYVLGIKRCVTHVRVRRVVVEVVVGQGSLEVRNTMSHPLYGQSASQGASRDAVGIAVGQLHGLWMVETSLQSPVSQTLEHAGLMSCLVTVGQAVVSRLSATARPTSTAATARSFILVYGHSEVLLDGLAPTGLQPLPEHTYLQVTGTIFFSSWYRCFI